MILRIVSPTTSCFTLGRQVAERLKGSNHEQHERHERARVPAVAAPDEWVQENDAGLSLFVSFVWFVVQKAVSA
ncbi:MAG TPA: hypothetical protein VG939_00135, partial [Caulobacteraceae bacterium]|nr:hypothetical protein [Caulobacteraceae bacterium]